MTQFISSPIGSDAEFADIEQRIGGRVGVFAQRAEAEHFVAYRAEERFMMCSVFKLLLVGHILHLVQRGSETFDRVIPYGRDDLLDYAPVASKYVNSEGMAVEDLCIAALQHSDNTAANLLLRIQGGPPGLTAYVRTLGDRFTRLDRIEPFLNYPIENCDYDTTTPAAMADSVHKLVVGTALPHLSRERLQSWLLGNTTGYARLNAGLPNAWRIAEKTGTGANGITNDVGVLYPPDGKPIVVAAFLSGSDKTRAECESALAEVAKIIVTRFEGINAV